MTTATYQKTVHASYAIGFASFVTVPDIVFGLFIGILHSAVEVLHLLFEFIESALDHLVEHTFHTGVHETQVIVFYILVTIGTAALYYLWTKAPVLLKKFKEKLITLTLEQKTKLINYWTEQTLLGKFKLLAIVNAGLAYLFLFSF